MIPYIINKFRGGISDENKLGIEGSFKYGYSLDIHGRNDVLMCGSSMVTANETLFTDLPQFFVQSSDGSTYAFGSAGSIYVRSGTTDDPEWNFAYNDENGAIKGAEEFQLSDGITYMYWATASSIARRAMTGSKDLPWTNATQNWKTERISSSAVWHTMGLAMGQLNIANNEGLATVPFSFAGEFNALDLNIRPGNQINAMEERDDYIVLGSRRNDGREEGHIWSWITTATNFVQKKKIPIRGINAMITTELSLLQGGDNGEIFPADFTNITPIAKLDGGGKVNPGGVDILDDLAVFGFYGGTYPGIWSFGRRHKNRAFSLNYEYRLAKTVAGSSVSTIGAIAVINGDLIASWGTTDGSTTTYGVDQVSSTTKASAVYEGLEFDGGNPHLNKTIDTIAVVMSPLPTSCAISAKFKLDKEDDWRYGVLGSGATTFSQSGEIIALFNVGKPGRIYEAGLELTPNGSDTPEVHAIISYISKETDEYA